MYIYIYIYLYLYNAPKFGAFSSKGALSNGLIDLSLGPALDTPMFSVPNLQPTPRTS